MDASGEIDRDEFFTLLRFLHVEVSSVPRLIVLPTLSYSPRSQIPHAHSSLKVSGTEANDAAVERLSDEQVRVPLS